MKIIITCLFKWCSHVLAYLYRVTEPVINLYARLIRLSKAQSKVRFSIPTSTQFDGDLIIIGTGNIIWGEHCRFGKDVVLETQGDGFIEIGDHVRLNQGTFIVSHDQVQLGSDVLIGEYCSIRDSNHMITKDVLIRSQAHDIGKIKIGRDVWIGRGTMVLKNSDIGDGAVIGANSLVTKKIFNNTISVGAPARELRKR